MFDTFSLAPMLGLVVSGVLFGLAASAVVTLWYDTKTKR